MRKPSQIMRRKYLKLSTLHFLLFTFLLIGMSSTITQAATGVKGTKSYSEEGFDINNCQIPITNYGKFGYRYGFWPKGAGEPYIYGAGIWIGAIKAGTKMVSCGYDCHGGGNDFMPGPPEHNADHASNSKSHPEDRVLSSINEEDLAIWPTLDSLGEPIVLSHQDMWCEYNDAWPDQHAWDPGTKPLNLHVRQLTFGWTTGLYENVFFLLYEIENVGDKPIKDMFIGNGADMDVGYADDDLVGCDVGRSLGYTYSLTQESGWKSKPPYYVGVKFLQGPRADDTVFVPALPGPENPDYPNTIMDTVLPGEYLVLTSFNRCTIGFDASTDEQRYLMLSGYNIETLEYDPWQGVIDNDPDDKRQVMGCGPFTLNPSEVDTFLVAVMFSNNSTGGLEYLLSEGDATQAAYDAEWVVPSPPSVPNITAVPMDQQITLVWDNSPLYEEDPFRKVMKEAGDTVYREYDFEGFRLWKSRTGLPDDWELLGEWDIENDVDLLPGDMWIRNDEHPDGFNVSGQKSNNEGLKYSYIDKDVLNGIAYFYAVTSFDFNTPGAIPNESDIKISTESGKIPVKCSPRAEPCDFVSPEVLEIDLTSGNTNSIDSLKVEIIGNIAVTGNTYLLEWNEIREKDGFPVYTYNIFNPTAGDSGEYISPISFEAPTTDEIYVFEEKTVPTITDTVIEGTPDTSTCDSIIIIKTTVWDTVLIDSVWKWSCSFEKPFDGLLLSGNINMNQQERHFLFKRRMEQEIVIKPNVYGKWIDTTVIFSATIVPHTYLDTFFTCFELPDSIKVIEDIGVHTYIGNLIINKFFSSGVDRNKWAYHGGRDIEIRWDYYHNSPDSLTMKVSDVLTGTEIPYDSAFGDNWCFGHILQPLQPANEYITSTQASLYHHWFYISGVWYYFDGGAALNWADQPDSGDVWQVFSSQQTIPPFTGTAYTIRTQKFSYGTTDDGGMELIKVVPNPYIIRADWDRSKMTRKIQFTHLPSKCTIRIYNLSGSLIRILEHESTSETGGVEEWNIRTKDEQIPASGIYIYHISTPDGKEKLGKFALIR